MPMCRRDSSDALIRKFLKDYQVNLLSMPGRRVRCGSVYIKQGKRITAPGLLSEIIEPELTLESPRASPHQFLVLAAGRTTYRRHITARYAD